MTQGHQALCAICLDHHPLNEFGVLTCGHAFCRASIENYLNQQSSARCPTCRTRFKAQHISVTLFLDFVPASEARARKLVSGLENMDAGSKAVSIQRTPKRIEEVMNGPGLPEQVVDSLLATIDDFKTRIAPVFQKSEEMAQEIASLKSQIRESELVIADQQRRLDDLRDTVTKRTKSVSEMSISRDKWKERSKELEAGSRRRKISVQNELEEARREQSRYKGFIEQYRRKNAKLKSDLAGAATIVLDDGDNRDVCLAMDSVSPDGLRSSRHTTSSRSTEHSFDMSYENNDIDPSPGFLSDWTPQQGMSRGLKRKSLGGSSEACRTREQSPFGPKRSRRIPPS
ncbi:hypothetical protein DL96DRAFT_1584511 [Flagelloscypha sp. PMI_526]|nr:hypothetical protein DL96DRAFT_1584511 [Flagelloscypha sp. PMI_526]